ncbi:unnamed protein product [Closterium sp. Yama58-4]|nr:unnamed protein product [Closterium sp. Yama58-4]
MFHPASQQPAADVSARESNEGKRPLLGLSPLQELDLIEAFSLRELPQQQHALQQGRSANGGMNGGMSVCSSLQGEADRPIPDRDAAFAARVNACPTSAGLLQCPCINVNWDDAAVPGAGDGAAGVNACPTSASLRQYPCVNVTCRSWWDDAAVPGAAATVGDLPPGVADPSSGANVALAGASDWLDAADNAIASFLIEAELVRIERVLLQSESAPHSTPLHSFPGSPLTAIPDQSCPILSPHSSDPNHSISHAKPMQFPAPAAAAQPAMLTAVSMPEAKTMEGCLKPDELFEAWCNGSFSRVLHGF